LPGWIALTVILRAFAACHAFPGYLQATATHQPWWLLPRPAAQTTVKQSFAAQSTLKQSFSAQSTLKQRLAAHSTLKQHLAAQATLAQSFVAQRALAERLAFANGPRAVSRRATDCQLRN